MNEEKLRTDARAYYKLKAQYETLADENNELNIQVVAYEKLLDNLHIDLCDLPIKIVNALAKNKIHYIGDLIKCSAEDLMMMGGFGKVMLRTVVEKGFPIRHAERILDAKNTLQGDISR